MTTEIDCAAPAITLPMERPLYSPVRKASVDSDSVRDAEEETDPALLFEQVFVDPGPLRDGVRRALQHSTQVWLAALIEVHPLEQGLAKLVTYLSLQDEAFSVVFDEQHRERVTWQELDGRTTEVRSANPMDVVRSLRENGVTVRQLKAPRTGDER